MKVRFRLPEKRDPYADRGLATVMAPSRRPGTPHWRWLLPMMVIAMLLMLGLARLMGLLPEGRDWCVASRTIVAERQG